MFIRMASIWFSNDDVAEAFEDEVARRIEAAYFEERERRAQRLRPEQISADLVCAYQAAVDAVRQSDEFAFEDQSVIDPALEYVGLDAAKRIVGVAMDAVPLSERAGVVASLGKEGVL